MKFPARITLLIAATISIHTLYSKVSRTEALSSVGTNTPKYYILDHSHAEYGMFGSYQAVVGFLDFIERQADVAGYEVFFSWGHYFDKTKGANWWEYYFEPIRSGSHHDAQIVYITDQEKGAMAIGAISTMSKERAHEIITRYIKIKPTIQQKIDNFYMSHLQGKYVISVHYRGTDKVHEASRAPYELFFQEIEKVVARLGNQDYVIYAASDEQQFITVLQQRFDHVVCQNAQRSFNGKPLHYGVNAVNGYKQGEETIIDFYLLAKGNILLRGHSNLSSSLQNFCPTMPVITLNQSKIGIEALR